MVLAVTLGQFGFPGLGGRPGFGGLGGGNPLLAARGGLGGLGGFGGPGLQGLGGGFQQQPPPPSNPQQQAQPSGQDQKKLVDLLANVISKNHDHKYHQEHSNDNSDAPKTPSRIQAIKDAIALHNRSY
ncbi:protein spalt-accessory-like [Haliotis rubra]|uniref:protein spalt-accessory-like n=1 Tax=Haliotis rubra TaxID=36100 RepID=UPI001EE4EC33|nr:protein spalt-accessory-like [Haliotis rubra]